ncbi:MAG TPA: hypothetical protein VNA25_14425 [Phycisphaerae bacterium]|nr:hypothetical protein [Phycisphaerae bacterium]
MIDTIQLKFPRIPTPDQLHDYWQTISHTAPNAAVPRLKYVYNTQPSDGIALKATYLPQDYENQPMLLLELSFPKALCGINWPMIPDIASAIHAVDSAIARLPGLPPINTIGTGVVTRLDACYNYQVGGNLQHYLRALSRLEYPHRQTVPFMGTGVEYRSILCKTKFYDKLLETAKQHVDFDLYPPPGTLRHETTLRGARDVAHKVFSRSQYQIKLQDIHPDDVINVLVKDLRHLGIENCSFATADLALQRLCAYYGNIKGPRLYGIYSACQDRRKCDIAAETHMQRHSVNRLLRQVRAAGIAPAASEAESLPPLQIIWPPQDDSPLAPRRTTPAFEESYPLILTTEANHHTRRQSEMSPQRPTR